MDLPKLTRAELAAMELVAQGLTDKKSAQQLGKCFYTVRCQVQAAIRKLGASNRPHAVAMMLDPERFNVPRASPAGRPSEALSAPQRTMESEASGRLRKT